MELLFNMCLALSIGVIIGACIGSVKMLAKKPQYTTAQIEKSTKMRKAIANLAKILTFFLLGIGLIWCIYFLVLGVVDATQVDYATGMAQLIVAVLTIISIMFAFFEFLRKK